jgi:hypothetical protein
MCLRCHLAPCKLRLHDASLPFLLIHLALHGTALQNLKLCRFLCTEPCCSAVSHWCFNLATAELAATQASHAEQADG